MKKIGREIELISACGYSEDRNGEVIPVLSRKHQELIAGVSKDIRSRERFERTKYFIQHGNTFVCEHVYHMVVLSLWLNEKFRLKADERCFSQCIARGWIVTAAEKIRIYPELRWYYDTRHPKRNGS